MPTDEPATPQAALCALCGLVIPPCAPAGQCPACLMSLGDRFDGFDGLEDLEDALLDAGQVRRVGDYELLEEIARGGMGIVYRARQTSLGREVALKTILAGELATPDSVQRFRNEASAAARLHHPNIVSVYEVGECDTQHYFSMRLVSGRQNIAAWAKALPPEARARRIAGMMAKVSHAVAFAHERGVLHRDLKSSNILVDEEGQPHVTDFGLAKLVHEHDSALTHSVAMLGSPSYMAPEQAEGRHGDVTTVTDVYGLGAVLYEMLAGRVPFLGKSPLATARMVSDQMPPKLEKAPRDLETICLKCLAKRPSQRYESAHALAEDLERFVRGEPIQAHPLTPPEALWRWARRRPKVAGLVGALLLVFLAGFSGVVWQWLRAEKANRHLRWQEIARQADSEDDAPLALAQLAAILRADPANWQATMLAMSVGDQRSFPVLAGPAVMPEEGTVTPPKLAADGTWFAAGTAAGVTVWETASGREQARLPLSAPSSAVAVSPGPWVLAAASNGQVHAWRQPGGPATILPRKDASDLLALDFSVDGRRVAARSASQVELWDCAAPETPPRSLGLDGPLNGACLSGDGARVLLWNETKAAVFETATGKPLFEAAAQERFQRGALSTDGSHAALIDGKFLARSWNLAENRELAGVDSGVAVWKFAALNADGSRLTLGGGSNDVKMFDTSSGLPVSPPMKHHYAVTALTVQAAGTRLLTYGDDGRACVWDASTGVSLMSAIWLETDAAAAIDMSLDGRMILVYPKTLRSGPAPVTVWRATATQQPRRQVIPDKRDFASSRISPDGRLGCLSVGPAFGAYVYELATGRVVLHAPTNGDVYVHLFSPDGSRYYALTANGWLYGWSLTDRQPLWPPVQQPGKIRPAEVSPDGTRIIAGHNDGRIRVYDTATGQVVMTLEHPGEIKVLRFAPDGSGRFLSASTDRQAHVWDLKTGVRLQSFTGHGHTIIAGAWSPDSRLLATASYDKTAQIWDAASGRAVSRPMQHLAWLSHLEFSPDGSLLATACRDGSVRLWHSPDGSPASAPLPQGSTAVTVRFTRDGSAFLVRDHLGFRFWSTDRAEPATVHFPAPLAVGMGMDSEAYRAIVTPDGRQVHLGSAMNEGALWTVSQPRGRVPPWFPAFLERLAQMRLGDRDDLRILPPDRIEDLIPADSQNEAATWARRVLTASEASQKTTSGSVD